MARSGLSEAGITPVSAIDAPQLSKFVEVFMFNPHSVDGHRTRLDRALASEPLASLVSHATTDPAPVSLAACADALAAAGFHRTHAQRLAAQIVQDRRAAAGHRSWEVRL